MAAQQSTQYNEIVDSYSSIYNNTSAETYPAATIEEAQFKHALLPSSSSFSSTQPSNSSRVTIQRPDIRGKHVLDLATGTGHYARRYLQWGAASVHAVDISSGMIAEARRESTLQNIPESSLHYFIGDVTDPTLNIVCPHTSDGKFDLVVSGWLLNYSPNAATMAAMFATIARHLTPDGWTVNMTSPLLTSATGTNPAQDAETLKAEETLLTAALTPPHGALARCGVFGRVLQDAEDTVKDGLKVFMKLGTLDKPVDDPGFAGFENFYLRPNVFDEALRMTNQFDDDRLEWLPTVLPDELVEDMRRLGRGKSYFNEMVAYPICRVGVARRKKVS